MAFGPHLLQALAREKGYTANILYLNLALASLLGVERYEEIFSAADYSMLGERLFARSAYGMPPLGNNPAWCTNEALSIGGDEKHAPMYYGNYPEFNMDEYLQIEKICKSFIEEAVEAIVSLSCKIVGCSAMTGQINCGIALLSGIKRNAPEIITIMGGANGEGEMARGIASLSDSIDYIFSGESESSFVNFLSAWSAQELPEERIITGQALENLDGIPLPDYSICFDQYEFFLGEKGIHSINTWYETSRGCWWAEKMKCSFCG
ncbi:MAG: hypothetical protein GY754_06080, partial [bacterium]|nr:hypothetical protein [bacterium]